MFAPRRVFGHCRVPSHYYSVGTVSTSVRGWTGLNAKELFLGTFMMIDTLLNGINFLAGSEWNDAPLSTVGGLLWAGHGKDCGVGGQENVMVSVTRNNKPTMYLLNNNHPMLDFRRTS